MRVFYSNTSGSVFTFVLRVLARSVIPAPSRTPLSVSLAGNLITPLPAESSWNRGILVRAFHLPSSVTPPMGSQELEWPASRVRDTFIGFFKDKMGHEFWKSSPVVPLNDPTLLFANAGSFAYNPYIFV